MPVHVRTVRPGTLRALTLRALTLPAVTALLAATAACSAAPSAAAPPAPVAAATGQAGAATGTSRPLAALDAAAVTQQLIRVIPTVKLTVTYDGTTDPNGKLGRPHQYVSKSAFDDSRVSGLPKAKEDESRGRRDSISYGGTVEIFATPEDARGWADYIDQGQQAMGSLLTPDYIFRNGTVVVRVSHLLTTEQASAYGRAIA
ncbi:hypothetical protein GCM10010495_33170 [Kitasatospora herbaricolor]|uniref:hypothetical protein n=1 Tax=Kitasatospora herbaricolor TaxID=68217 RepID=UPI00174A478F|nr:hypothetical protein [Kitasatospora herbaricolor]MDQ0307615.1 hypothetical protein [Kitasatospora herbaricolor]GGV16277.1 hypothetical protein GCM10010495_33170 [Kitasatospora herbaricolor]